MSVAPVFRRLVAALVALSLAAAPSPSGATPVCQFSTGGHARTLTVAMRSSSGLILSVDWGDGTRSTTTRPTGPGRGRAFLRHTYDAPGTYAVVVRTTGPEGEGCGAQLVAETPFEPVSGEARSLMIDDVGPDSSDMVADADLGPALAEVDPPSRSEPAGPSEPLLARGVAAVASVIRSIAGLFWGR